MRILIVHNKYKQYGGEDTVVEQEFLAYQELGYTVELYLEDNANLMFMDLVFSIFNPISFFRLKRKIKTFNPDVIHVHNMVFKLSPSIFWSIPANVKTLITLHNYRFICPSGTLFYEDEINTESMKMIGFLGNIWKGVYQDSRIKTMILGMVFRINFLLGSFNRIDKFIFLTAFAKNIHLNWKPNRFVNAHVKPNFLMDDHKKQKHTKKEIDLIFIGRFTSEKGIMKVLSTLIDHKKLKIHLVGDGPKFEEVCELSKNARHIHIHGSKSRKEVFELLDKSRFLIFPSIWFEGMPMTIIEAYSRKIPVISRKIGAMQNMILDGVTGFHYNNTEELSNILNSLNTIDYATLSNNAYDEFCTRYSKPKGLKNLSILVNEDSN